MEESAAFQQSPFSSSSSTSSQPGSSGGGGKAKKIIFLVIILLILGSIAYGATVLLGTSSEKPAEETTTTDEFFIPTDTPTPADSGITPTEEANSTPEPTSKSTPTPTKKATSSTDSTDAASGLDRADLTIVVQNGSGESGVAKVMADKLTALGYTISSTGNADNYDYAQTVIKVKAASKAYLSLLKKDLEDDYTIGTATSDYTGSGDAVVIVGKE